MRYYKTPLKNTSISSCFYTSHIHTCGRYIPAEKVDDFKLFLEPFVSSDGDIAPLERHLFHICYHIRFTFTQTCKTQEKYVVSQG